MGKEKSDAFEIWLNIMVSLLAIMAIRSIFENDNSKIISNKGKGILSDEDKLKAINKKILESEKANDHKEIFI